MPLDVSGHTQNISMAVMGFCFVGFIVYFCLFVFVYVCLFVFLIDHFRLPEMFHHQDPRRSIKTESTNIILKRGRTSPLRSRRPQETPLDAARARRRPQQSQSCCPIIIQCQAGGRRRLIGSIRIPDIDCVIGCLMLLLRFRQGGAAGLSVLR